MKQMLIALLLVVTSILPYARATQATGTHTDPIAGTCVYFDGLHAAQSDAQQRIERRLDQIAESGFSSVCIAFPFYMETWTASEVSHRERFVPTRDQLGNLVAEIRRRNMSVGLKPILEEGSLVNSGPSGTWRGTIAPEDPAAWFSSYTGLLAHYAELATEHDIAWLAIGTEFNSLEAPGYEPYWDRLIEDVRGAFAGNTVPLLYSQNHDMVPTSPGWFGQLDILAIDAYFPLEGVGDDASVDEIARAMEQHRWKIEQLRAQYPDKPLYITELGVSSVNNVYQAPYLWGELSGGPVNLQTQQRYAAAACQFYGGSVNGDPLVEGIYWWFTTINPPDDPLQDTGFDFIGKPAQETIEACNASFLGHQGR